MLTYKTQVEQQNSGAEKNDSVIFSILSVIDLGLRLTIIVTIQSAELDRMQSEAMKVILEKDTYSRPATTS